MARHRRGALRGGIRSPFLSALGLVLLCFPPAAAQISGFVSDPDLRPALRAQVELYSPDSPETPRRFEVSDRGTFRVEPAGAGLFRLNFTAPFFEPQGLAVYLSPGGEVKIDVRLKPYEWVEDFKNVRLIGDFNGFSRTSGTVALHALSDGTFFADVQSSGERMAYRVIGLVRDSPLSVPGTHFDEITLDGSGRFVSVLRSRPGKVRIFLDPAVLPRSSGESKVIFEPADSPAAAIAAIDRDIRLHGRNHDLALSAWKASGHAERDFHYDWSDVWAELRKRIGEEKEGPVRQGLWVALLDLGRLGCAEVDRTVAREALAAVPAESPLWALSPGYLLFDSLELAGGLEGGYGEYFRRVVTANPSREVRALTLERAYNVALGRHDLERAKDYYRRLSEEFGDLLPGRRVKARPPESRFAPGKPMPSFEFASLEDPGRMVGDRTFRGRYYLLDFWASWCAPCLDELKNLQALYSRFHDRGFEILSVSFDQAPEDVRQFRSKKWAMPWRHAFLGLDEFRVGSRVCDYFELTEIPKSVLVDRDGVIVAAGDDARGEKLARIIADRLKNR